jgi:hypothetical protein
MTTEQAIAKLGNAEASWSVTFSKPFSRKEVGQHDEGI